MLKQKNQTVTVPIWGGGFQTIKKEDFECLYKVEGITAIKMANQDKLIKIRLTPSEFWNTFYALSKRGA